MYDPDQISSDKSWKNEIPQAGKPRKISNLARNYDQKLPSTVMFVPNSNRGILLKKLEAMEPLMEKLSGYRVRLVESAGTPLSRLFILDLSDGRQPCVDCPVCEFHTGKGASRCKRKSKLYQSVCQVCKGRRKAAT